jgi:hypothetical protein
MFTARRANVQGSLTGKTCQIEQLSKRAGTNRFKIRDNVKESKATERRVVFTQCLPVSLR